MIDLIDKLFQEIVAFDIDMSATDVLIIMINLIMSFLKIIWSVLEPCAVRSQSCLAILHPAGSCKNPNKLWTLFIWR